MKTFNKWYMVAVGDTIFKRRRHESAESKIVPKCWRKVLEVDSLSYGNA